MKSYTDIEQSKKLAEFLSLESADMSYSFDFNSEIYEISTTSYKDWVVPKYAQPDNGFGQVIPCWSLTALLDLMPRIEFEKPLIDLSPNLDSEEVAIYYPEDAPYIVKDNLVDACCEMICWLKENNKL